MHVGLRDGSVGPVGGCLNPELFIHLAEIAGVFVGFGALIAVRSSGPTDPLVVAPMRMVVPMGMPTIVAALTPGALSRFDLGEHQLSTPCSALYVAGWTVILVASRRTPEFRPGWAAQIERGRAQRPGLPALMEWVGWVPYVLYMIAMFVAPIVILLGAVPDLEAALYYALVVLFLLGAGWALLLLVFAQRLPERA